MENSKPTQAQRVLAYIREFGSITQLQALQDLGVMRLASRISELRKSGYDIVSKTVAVNNRWEETCHIKRYSERGRDPKDVKVEFVSYSGEYPCLCSGTLVLMIDGERVELNNCIVSDSIRTWADKMPPISNPHFVATVLYAAGYRKQSVGEWADQYQGKYDNQLYKCSECGETAFHDEKRWFLTHYCPNCGAKMKGGEQP